jgi:TolA-binding protein
VAPACLAPNWEDLTVYRLLLACWTLGAFVLVVNAADPPKDTPLAAKTRATLLKQKVSVDYADVRLAEIVDDLKEQVKGLRIKLDIKNGVSQNRKLTFKADDLPLETVLDQMFKSEKLGYIVISNEKDPQYDGGLLIVMGDERGYPAGTEPPPVAKVEDPKPVTPVTPEPPKPPVSSDDAAKNEMQAEQALRLAKLFVKSKPEAAIERLNDLIKKYPTTKAAEEAKALLAELKK